MSVYIAAELRRQVRQRFSECCAYCRTAETLTVVTFEIEHIVPSSAGGQTVFENLCLACPTCNRHKADRTTAIDPVTGQVVTCFTPSKTTGAITSLGVPMEAKSCHGRPQAAPPFRLCE